MLGFSGAQALVTLKTPQEVYNFIFDADTNMFVRTVDLDLWSKYTGAETKKIYTQAKKKHLGFIKSDTNQEIMEATLVFEKENANFANAVHILWKYCFSSGGRMSTSQLSQAQAIMRNLRISQKNLEDVLRSRVLADIQSKKRDDRFETAQMVERLITVLIKAIDKSIYDCRQLMDERK